MGQQVALVVESVGYRATSTNITLSPGTIRHDVTLPEEAIALDAVLVTGTAARRDRRAQAASVAAVDAACITEIAPVSSVAGILQSRVPGGYLQQKSGATGSAQRIRIRGMSLRGKDWHADVRVTSAPMTSRFVNHDTGL